MKPDLKKAFEAALNEKVVITKDKKEIVLTKAALGIQQLVNQFAKGDRHARRDLFQYAALLGVDLHAKDIITEALGINEEVGWSSLPDELFGSINFLACGSGSLTSELVFITNQVGHLSMFEK